jgi:hypothetical protein
MPAVACRCGGTAGWPPFTCRACGARVKTRRMGTPGELARGLRSGPLTWAEDFTDRVHVLAMLALQSGRYRADAEYRQAVDDVLGFYKQGGIDG